MLVQDYTASRRRLVVPEDVHLSVCPLRIGLIVKYVRHPLDCNFFIVRPIIQRSRDAG